MPILQYMYAIVSKTRGYAANPRKAETSYNAPVYRRAAQVPGSVLKK